MPFERRRGASIIGGLAGLVLLFALLFGAVIGFSRGMEWLTDSFTTQEIILGFLLLIPLGFFFRILETGHLYFTETERDQIIKVLRFVLFFVFFGGAAFALKPYGWLGNGILALACGIFAFGLVQLLVPERDGAKSAKGRVTLPRLEFPEANHKGFTFPDPCYYSRDDDAGFANYLDEVEPRGFIDQKGEWVIPPCFIDQVSHFVEGLALGDGVFINPRGKKIIVPPDEHVQYMHTFSGGLAVFGQYTSGDEMRRGFMDIKGDIIIPPAFARARSFSEGWAAVFQPEGTTWEYIDRNGLPMPLKDFVLSPEVEARDFHESRVAIHIEGKWGFMDRRGELIVNPSFEAVGDFSQQRAWFLDQGRFGFINPAGAIAIPASFDEVRSFREGFAAVKMEGRWGFIDADGRWVISPVYFQAGDFHQGRARVEMTGALMSGSQEWTFLVGGLTKVDVFPRFWGRNVGDFHEGLAAFMDAGQFWGYIDLKGDVAISPVFYRAWYFQEGLAPAFSRPHF